MSRKKRRCVGVLCRAQKQYRRLKLRTRLALLGGIAVAIGLLITILISQAVVAYALQTSSDNAAQNSADDIALLLRSGQIPNPIPVRGSGAVVQIIDEKHSVRGASASGDRLVPFLTREEIAWAREGTVFEIDGARVNSEGMWRVAAAQTGLVNDPLWVIVAVPSIESSTAFQIVERVMWITFTLVVLGATLVIWVMMGRALHPVERMRTVAAEIGETDSERRLPLPPSGDEIQRLAYTLNEMLDRIHAGSERQRQFVADVAHELRSPLASLRTQVEISTRLRDLSENRCEQEESVSDMLAEIDRLSQIVNDLLLISRADDGHVPVSPQPLNVLEVARSCAVMLSPNAVRIEVEQGEVLAELDERHLKRILYNLLTNGVRHAHSVVRVRAATARHYTYLTITDDGNGIPPERRREVWERFTRLDESRNRDEGGSGLGLPIVARLVHINGGVVTLLDPATLAEPGVTHGLAVAMWFPRVSNTSVSTL